ncbi:MAG: ABC transporter ATP-binding protein, partial [Balneolales bacterium]
QDTIYDLGTVGIRFSFWAENVGVLFIIGVLAWGSMLVLNEELLLGALVAIIQMSGQMIPAVNRLALTNLQLQEAHVAFDRMFEFTSLPAEGLEEGNNETSLPALSKIEIEGLSFRFSGRSQLLKNITFTVNKGNITGLLGGNGSGKTTIIHLLRRFYESENGKIMVNNSIPWKEYSSRKWRNCIASVSQDCKIFNASLTENISLGKETWKSDRVIRFCNECGFEKYFLAFPQGYNTLLGEEGVNISGGQRQLVALARALYQKPELLLLDEATSGMDIEMEREVLQLLSVMKANMSIVLVTHRVQSAKYADYIYIIEKGIITDKGHPRDLLERDNLFSNALADFSLVS